MFNLPLEIWTAILDHLPLSARRVCLSTNRLLHDIAVRSLFTTVHIYLGAWETLHDGLDDEASTPDLDEATTPDLDECAIAHSKEILKRIIDDPAFASIVRTLIVHAHMKDGHISRGQTFTCLSWSQSDRLL